MATNWKVSLSLPFAQIFAEAGSANYAANLTKLEHKYSVGSFLADKNFCSLYTRSESSESDLILTEELIYPYIEVWV